MLVYCQLLLQNIEELTSNAYPKMINLEGDQKHLKSYTSLLLEAGQEFYSIYHALNSTMLKFNPCLNHLTKLIITSERLYPFSNHDSLLHVPFGVIHKIFSVLFGKSDDSTTINKVEQNKLKENQLMEKE